MNKGVYDPWIFKTLFLSPYFLEHIWVVLCPLSLDRKQTALIDLEDHNKFSKFLYIPIQYSKKTFNLYFEFMYS
jgi:hypothetical protein